MWHLEIVAVSFLQWPFQVPTFAGATLSGYNILMDLLIYMVSLIGIDPFFMLFKIIPVVWFVALTLTTIRYIRILKLGKPAEIAGLLLVYFAGHAGYILQWIVEGSPFAGRQSFSLQSLTAQLNTQFALSLPLILTQLTILARKERTLKTALFMGMCSFLIMGLKFYGGVASAMIVFFYLFDGLLLRRKFTLIIRDAMIIGGFFIASILMFYNPFEATQSGSIFSFSPFATVHSVIEAHDMVYLPDLVNARYFLYEQGWSPKLVAIELFSAGIYMLLNFGTRVLGLIVFCVRAVQKKVARTEWYLFSTIMVLFLANIMLIQKGDWWNTVQFGYYAIFLSNFLLLIFLGNLLKKKTLGMTILVGLIIALSLPSNIRAVMDFTDRNTLYLSRYELQAMQFLKAQPYGVVFNSFEAKEGYSFLDYKTSGYVAAFTGKPLWFAHPGPLNIIGVDVDNRQDALAETSCPIDRSVEYIYFVKKHDASIQTKCASFLRATFNTIYENEEVLIKKRIVTNEH